MPPLTRAFDARAVDFAVTFANTVEHYLFDGSITWIPDASMICLTVMTLLGAAAYLRPGSGMACTAIVATPSANARWRDLWP